MAVANPVNAPFLPDHELRPGELPAGEGLTGRGLILGQGSWPLEVVVYDARGRPGRDVVGRVWKERWGSRPVSLLVVALYGDKCSLCGHTEHARAAPPVHFDLDRANVERLCSTALGLPDRNAVDRFLREQIPETESPIFGVRNQGLLATHVIQRGRAEFEPDIWDRASDKAAAAIRASSGSAVERDRKLLNVLGYTIEPLTGPASLLTDRGSRVALAVFLDQNETAEISNKRFGDKTPISYAIHLAQRENLRWVIVARGPELRLYPTATGIGVGRRGLTDTFLHVNTDLLSEDLQALLWLAFSAEGLAADGTLQNTLLERSDRYARDIGIRLRDRIYHTVIPRLAMAIVRARKLKRPTGRDLELTYQMAMLVLFRLLFIAYAEDHDLLPYKTNEEYKRRSLTEKAKELRRLKLSEESFDPKSTSQWQEVNGLWDAVRGGQEEWGVAPYDGGLFDDDLRTHPAGAEIAKIKLTNRDFGVVLSSLLLDEKTPEGLGPVDFRSLGVREFGTIYEGLLENELSVADCNLTTDRKGLYKPTDDRAQSVVHRGEIYLHNRSGARKASGSYYTKEFAVEHLLDQALEPALTEHLEKVGALVRSDPDKAARQLFEFYVADIAMGSGHFLINAIDRIEKRFLGFVSRHSLPGVDVELEKLRKAARGQLGDALDEGWLEPNKLLRRLIARRCIYGVDLNPLAVELARLSIWIHTFVPGLPLSFLDHNLVCGNSLVGIATFDEVLPETVGKGETLGLFDDPARRLLGSAVESIRELRILTDSDMDDIKRAKAAHHECHKALTDAQALFDIMTAARFDKETVEMMRSGVTGFLADLTHLDHLFGAALHKRARKATSAMPPFHFPIAFPEVFLRDDPGFDVIIGNPPWEEATVEEDAFWARNFPGLRGMRQADQEILKAQYRSERPDLVRLLEGEIGEAEQLREILVTGPYPGMGTGDPDLYKAFCWRFWDLTRKPGGRIAVVLPRSVWFAKGSTEFRCEVLERGQIRDLTYLLNNKKWVFPEVHPQYTVVLSVVEKTDPDPDEAEVRLRGPYRSPERFQAGVKCEPVHFAVKDVLSWTDSASLPLLPSQESADVFLQLRKAPRLDSSDGDWQCRPHTELHATNDKHLMTLTNDPPKGYWPVYKGESFDIWSPDTGKYYAWVDPVNICQHLQKKRERGARRGKKSVYRGFSDDWWKDPVALPCLHPRLAFRDVTRATDTRTVRAALVPPEIVMANSAPYLLWPRGDSRDTAYLLGVLCSLPLDWYARCFVEIHLNFHVLAPFPVPRPERSDPLWQRVITLAGRLACPDKRFSSWARSVGVKCGPLKDDEKTDMIAELDAVVAHLYSLKEKHLRHVFETFHEGWNHEERMRATLKHFREWKTRL